MKKDIIVTIVHFYEQMLFESTLGLIDSFLNTCIEFEYGTIAGSYTQQDVSIETDSE